jgi:hypothetical protein
MSNEIVDNAVDDNVDNNVVVDDNAVDNNSPKELDTYEKIVEELYLAIKRRIDKREEYPFEFMSYNFSISKDDLYFYINGTKYKANVLINTLLPLIVKRFSSERNVLKVYYEYKNRGSTSSPDYICKFNLIFEKNDNDNSSIINELMDIQKDNKKERIERLEIINKLYERQSDNKKPKKFEQKMCSMM